MKFALLLTLAASFAASALPVSGQEPSEGPGSFDLQSSGRRAGSLAHDVTREAARLAAAARESPSVAQQSDESASSDWARVRKLAPGTEVVVSLGGSDLILKRYFLSADDSGVTLLNLTHPTLPAAASRALREIASQHREYIEGAGKGGVFIEGQLRLTSTGVFMADRKVSDLQDVVDTRARQKVAEIKVRKRGRGVWGHLGPLGGYFVGAMSGGYAAGFACRATVGRSRCDTGSFLAGAVVGGLAGMGYGIHAARRETEDAIYRAPVSGGTAEPSYGR
jgi:hypothetical protein